MAYTWRKQAPAVTPKAPAKGDKKASFSYDYMGRRIRKQVETWSGTAWNPTSDTRYVYDGWNLLRELNATGQTLKSYVWGLDLSGTLQGTGGHRRAAFNG